MPIRCVILVIAVLVVCVQTLVAVEDAPPDLADLTWLAGHWSSEDDGTTQEELWMAPAGGVMLGLHRDSNDERQRAFFEFLRIEQREDTLAYIAQPGGGEPTTFMLDSIGQDRVVFTNPDHDFPKRISYWLDDEGALNAEATGEIDGQERAMQWCWKQVEDDDSAE